MPTYSLGGGVEAEFPFEAYPCQLAYMRKVAECLSAGHHAVIESPTGTGKTLTLLCSALAWGAHERRRAEAEGRKPRLSRIFYCSRTHTQLKQVMAELQRTEYAGVRVAVLASRKHYCVHPAVTREHGGESRNAACARMRSGCQYFLGLDRRHNAAVLDSARVADVEELASLGRKHTFCPFYFSRRAMGGAELVLCPYNYVLDKRMRQSLEINVSGAVVIVDEAHNLAASVREQASVSVNVAHLLAAEAAVVIALRGVPQDEAGKRESLHAVRDRMRAVAEQAEEWLKRHRGAGSAGSAPSQADPMQDPRTLIRYGDAMAEFLGTRRVRLGPEDAGNFLHDLDVAEEELAARPQPGGGMAAAALQALRDILGALADAEEPPGDASVGGGAGPGGGLRSAFRFVLSKDDSDLSAHTTLQLLCVDCRPVMRSLAAGGGPGQAPVRGLVLTSGTLAPLSVFAAELGIEVPPQGMLSNSHVITPSEQLLAAVVPRGPGQVELNSRFQNRASGDFLHALGVTCVFIFQGCPGGVLVFFQSFAFMRQVIDSWQRRRPGAKHSIWEALTLTKEVFQEGQRGPADTREMLRDYAAAAERGRGAALFAVLRGNMSEGIDFSDGKARAAVIIGVPFANHTSLRTRLQIAHAQSIRMGDWYLVDALRSVNQAVGRVIRHRHDFGGIFLLDARYQSGQCRQMLPSWVRSEIRVAPGDGLPQLCDSFFSKRAALAPPPPPCPRPQPEAKRRRPHRVLHPAAGSGAGAAAPPAPASASPPAARPGEGAGPAPAPAAPPAAPAPAAQQQQQQQQQPLRQRAEPQRRQRGAAGGGEAGRAGEEISRFYAEVVRFLSAEQRARWKALLCEELAALFRSRGPDAVVREWMRQVLAPWLVESFGADSPLLRGHVAVLPEALHEMFDGALYALGAAPTQQLFRQPLLPLQQQPQAQPAACGAHRASPPPGQPQPSQAASSAEPTPQIFQRPAPPAEGSEAGRESDGSPASLF